MFCSIVFACVLSKRQNVELDGRKIIIEGRENMIKINYTKQFFNKLKSRSFFFLISFPFVFVKNKLGAEVLTPFSMVLRAFPSPHGQIPSSALQQGFISGGVISLMSFFFVSIISIILEVVLSHRNFRSASLCTKTH